MNYEHNPKDLSDKVSYVSSLLIMAMEMLPKVLEDIEQAVIEDSFPLEEHVYTKSIWSNIGNIFILHGMHKQAKLVYTKMLEAIQKYENKTKRRIYKGLPYYNLGLINYQLTRMSEGSHKKAKRYLEKACEEEERFFGLEKAESSAAKKTLLHLEEHSQKTNYPKKNT